MTRSMYIFLSFNHIFVTYFLGMWYFSWLFISFNFSYSTILIVDTTTATNTRHTHYTALWWQLEKMAFQLTKVSFCISHFFSNKKENWNTRKKLRYDMPCPTMSQSPSLSSHACRLWWRGQNILILSIPQAYITPKKRKETHDTCGRIPIILCSFFYKTMTTVLYLLNPVYFEMANLTNLFSWKKVSFFVWKSQTKICLFGFFSLKNKYVCHVQTYWGMHIFMTTYFRNFDACSNSGGEYEHIAFFCGSQ